MVDWRSIETMSGEIFVMKIGQAMMPSNDCLYYECVMFMECMVLLIWDLGQLSRSLGYVVSYILELNYGRLVDR